MIALENTRWEDFEYTYLDELHGNPMGWLGNGYTKADYDGSSRTAYLDPSNIDYPPVPEARVPLNSVALRYEKETKGVVSVHDERVDAATIIDLIVPAGAV